MYEQAFNASKSTSKKPHYCSTFNQASTFLVFYCVNTVILLDTSLWHKISRQRSHSQCVPLFTAKPLYTMIVVAS